MSTTPWVDAKHTYEPNPVTKRCRSGWYNDDGRWIECGSTQASSVLHYNDEADSRERHYHDGGDCMCFESQDD